MKALKRFLLLFALILLAAVVGAVGMFVATFRGVKALPDTQALPGGAITVKDGIVSAAIVPVDAQRAILIDCGEDREAQKIQQALADAKLSLEAILVTHGHKDHIGGCATLGAPIVALAAEAEGLRGESRSFHRGPISRVMGAHGLGLQIDRVVHDGEELRFGDKSVRVFAVPGHTAGSAAYLVDGVLHLGDAASAGEDGSVIRPLWVFSDDVEQGKASLRLLAGKLHPDDVTTFAFAHSASMPADLTKLVTVE